MPAMNFKTLLLLPALVFSFDGVPLRNPSPATAQVGGPSLNSSSATRENCVQAKAAVVTVYAGKEIGSGSIVSPEGVVLTNNHVVRDAGQRQARTISVKLADGSRYPGQLVSTDTRNDLALIKISANRQFPTVPLANADGVQAGQRVCAIGSPFGKSGVITEGTFTNFRSNGDLKSAVVLRPGNSGGPLLNARGEMIGVNKAIWQSSAGENSGISFSTSAAIAKNFIQRNNFSVTARSPQTPNQSPPAIAQAPVDRTSGRLGVVLDTRSLIVTQVDSGSPAAASGLRRGDRLLAVNGDRLLDFDGLRSFLSQRPNSAVLTIARQQQVANLRVRF
ncbi:MAG TPA: trypsin-like peptidase domain-containing protein [Thermosynechococcaceae cyanobacterium]